MTVYAIFLALLAIPLLSGVAGFTSREPGVIFARCAWGVYLSCAMALGVIVHVHANGSLHTPQQWLRIDALSAFHIALLNAVFLLTTLFSRSYFLTELLDGRIRAGDLRLFSLLWGAALSAMTLTVISNNLGLMWVGMEATTLLTAFMISLRSTKASLEAMWKYLILCSIGIGFAFMGTILAGAAGKNLGLGFQNDLLWSQFMTRVASLDPMAMKACFLFVLVGYGTKAGLAPLHNWLPDANSQAPAPVAALMSGFMDSLALYCIMRYIPLVEGATGNTGWTRDILQLFGLTSILVAAGFIIFQHDMKRLLAYSSVEHVGIITLALGLGTPGYYAALLHTLNHAFGKSLAFMATGRLGQTFGSHEISHMRGCARTSPLWGVALFAAVAALLGTAPFGIFMSELQVTRAAIIMKDWIVVGLFLIGVLVIFVTVLRHLIDMTWGPSTHTARPPTIRDWSVVVIPLAILLITGLTSSAILSDWIRHAAAIIGGVA